METPKTRFCWACMRQLWGNHHEAMVIDGHKRILHKKCAEIIKRGGEVRVHIPLNGPRSCEPEFIGYFIDGNQAQQGGD